MLKYIQVIYDDLEKVKIGIRDNSGAWVGQTESEATVDADMTELQNKDEEITSIKQLLANKQLEARQLAAAKQLRLEVLYNTVKVVHQNDKTKWIQYGIVEDTTPTPRNRPTQELNLSISTDLDGQGSLLKILNPDSLADSYLWEKGIGTNPEETVFTGQWQSLIQTSKSTVVDDDVIPGKRYFYRVRAFNRRGYGPWSDTVNRVE